MKKINWRGWLLFGYLFLYFLAQTFIGSRPPFSFIPIGLGILIVLGIGIGAAVMAHRQKHRRNALMIVFTVCCLIYAGYILAQSFMYIHQGGNIFWVRSLSGLPLIFLAWRFVTDPYRFLRVSKKEDDV